MQHTVIPVITEVPKVQLVPGSTDSSATFIISQEDHTLGNALRFVLMRNPATSFCGYSMPHPSEALVNVRLQTTGKPAVTVLREGLGTIIAMAEHFEALLGQTQGSSSAAAAEGEGEAAEQPAAAAKPKSRKAAAAEDR